MKTLYDTLVLMPAADPFEINAVYEKLVRGLLDSDFTGPASMRSRQAATEIAKLTAAFVVLSHSDRRKAYDRRLKAKGLICPLCDGRGCIREEGFSFRSVTCAACTGTGKGWIGPTETFNIPTTM